MYLSPAELKATLSLSGTTFADGDIDRALATAAATIDRYCGRTFDVPAADTFRLFKPTSSSLLIVDDLVSVSEVAQDVVGDGSYSDVRAASTFRTEPLNASDGPITSIRSTSGSWRGVVKVTGKFGWSETPPEVVDVTLMLASALLKRQREAPFGIASFGGESGSAMRIVGMDNHIKSLLDPLRRGRRIAVA